MSFQYRIIYSQPHDFLYHPELCPDKAGQVAAKGWRCVAECEFEGVTGKAEVCLGMSQESAEECAKSFALSDWESKFSQRQQSTP